MIMVQLVKKMSTDIYFRISKIEAAQESCLHLLVQGALLLFRW